MNLAANVVLGFWTAFWAGVSFCCAVGVFFDNPDKRMTADDKTFQAWLMVIAGGLAYLGHLGQQ